MARPPCSQPFEEVATRGDDQKLNLRQPLFSGNSIEQPFFLLTRVLNFSSFSVLSLFQSLYSS